MWSISELKQRAKTDLKNNYWVAVLFSVVYAFITCIGAGNGSGSSQPVSDGDLNSLDNVLSSDYGAAIMGIVGVTLMAAVVASVIIGLFIRNPMRVSYARFNLDCSEGTGTFGTIVYGYKSNIARNAFGLFATDIIIALWSLLFVIPGVVKAYSYMLVPYILAENPSVTAKEAREMSASLMNGNKWRAFMLDCSFIGWGILSVFTFGLLAVFYVTPYAALTHAELYKALNGDNNTYDNYGYQGVNLEK